MKYYFDVTLSRAPVLRDSVHNEIITRHWYDNVTRALRDQGLISGNHPEGAVSNVCAVDAVIKARS